MSRMPFTANEKLLIRQCALRVWQAIAYDIFTAVHADGRDTMTRDEVIEVVMDCDRVVKEVEKCNHELARRLYRAEGHQLEMIVREAFPNKEYA